MRKTQVIAGQARNDGLCFLPSAATVKVYLSCVTCSGDATKEETVQQQ
jgi:hypothetical protein